MLNSGAQSVRAVIFLPNGEPVLPQALFGSAVGQAPENVQTNRGPVPGSILNATASAIIGDLNWMLTWQPARLDLMVTPHRTDLGTTAAMQPTISDVSAVLDAATEAAIKIAGEVGEIPRMAMLVPLAKFHDDIPLANQDINTILPYDIKLTDEQDFVFQINRRFHLDQHLECNRLLKFSVERVEIVNFPVVAPMQITISPLMFNDISLERSVFYSAVFNIDVNTVPKGLLFGRDRHRPIFEGLKDQINTIRSIGFAALG